MAKYVKLFDIRKVKTENGVKAKFQLAKGVEILVDGKKVDFGKYNSTFLTTVADRTSFLERMVEQGKMKQETVDKQLEYFEEKQVSSFVEVKMED